MLFTLDFIAVRLFLHVSSSTEEMWSGDDCAVAIPGFSSRSDHSH